MKILVVGLLFLLAVSPIWAQEITETPEQCKTEAQAWYDAIDSKNALRNAYVATLDNTLKTTDRANAVREIQDIRTDMEAPDYPPCIETARNWYLDGLAHLVAVAQAAVNQDFSQFFVDTGLAYQNIGAFRGYLAGVGVSIDYPPDITLFLK